MPSSIVVRFNLLVAGDPLPFAQPFPAPALALEEAPARFTAHIAASGTATVWQGAPLPSSADFIVLTADQDCTITFTTSAPATFTLPLRAGGFPLVLPKGAGSTVTKIEATNGSTTTAVNVVVLIGKAA